MAKIKQLANGLTLIVEEIPHVESCAYTLYIPGGSVLENSSFEGSSLILSELTTKGAGSLDSRALSEAFDQTGINHSEYAASDRFVYSGACLAQNIDRALELLGLILTNPKLPAKDIESIRNLFLQDILALPDNPSRRCSIELGKIYYPAPYNRSGLGTVEGLNACNSDQLRQEFAKFFRPDGCVLSVAGNVNDSEISRLVEKALASWKGEAGKLPAFGEMPKHRAQHIQSESAQLQIAFAFPAAKFSDPLYYSAKLVSGILSGGMHGRLFIEVREKRGLCYSVYARHSATNHYGMMYAYAGTTPERAHETLQVMLKEFRGLSGSISAEEMQRAKANLKAQLTISEESTSARSSSNASDWWLNRRVRSLQEIISNIDALQIADIENYLQEYPLKSFMLVTLGSKELNLADFT